MILPNTIVLSSSLSYSGKIPLKVKYNSKILCFDRNLTYKILTLQFSNFLRGHSLKGFSSQLFIKAPYVVIQPTVRRKCPGHENALWLQILLSKCNRIFYSTMGIRYLDHHFLIGYIFVSMFNFSCITFPDFPFSFLMLPFRLENLENFTFLLKKSNTNSYF